MPVAPANAPGSRAALDEMLTAMQPYAVELATVEELQERDSVVRHTRKLVFGAETLTETAQAIRYIRRALPGGSEVYPLAPFEHLGEGGLNTVFSSEPLYAPGHRVTVRIPEDPKSFVENEARQQKIARLYTRLAALDTHPNIPSFLGTGITPDGEHCEVFCYVPGDNLVQLILESPFSEAEFYHVAVGSSQALAHLHRNGVVHCDLKPGNILVDAKRTPDHARKLRRVSLIDFDVLVEPEDLLREYALGYCCGTLGYMPPEAFGAQLPDAPAEREQMAYARDVYAYGLTLYNALLGSRPSDICGDADKVVKHKRSRHEVRLPFPRSVPLGLQDLLRQMCRSDWRVRPGLDEVLAKLTAMDIERRSGRTHPMSSSALLAGQTQMGEELDATVAAEFPRIGPYQLISRDFEPNYLRPDTGEHVSLAALQDACGQPHVGIPAHFTSEQEAQAVFAERGVFIAHLNEVRLRHPQHFHGIFDLVLEMSGESQWTVWTVRPMLTEARALPEYLEQVIPATALRERLAILRRIAESLAALEEAGYDHPGISADRIFFVPAGDDMLAGSTIVLAADTTQAGYDFPSSRQETMDMAFARLHIPGNLDPNAELLLGIAASMGIMTGLDAAVIDTLGAINTLATWSERVELLRTLEQRTDI